MFDDFADALNYANSCVRSPGLVKRQVALLATPIADYFSHQRSLPRRAACGHQPDRRGERRTLRQPVTAPSREQRHPAGQRRGPDAQRLVNGILLNHTTLHALKVDNTLTYLQTAFDPLRYPQQILQMEQHFAGEVMSHIEFLRDIEGTTASGLQLVRYTTPGTS